MPPKSIINKGLFTSKSDDWETPQELFDELNKEFKFKLDVCASAKNAKCKDFISKNSLESQWGGCNWMNPPYGRQIGKWIKKASENSLTVCLLPARTDTKWFHDYILGKAEIRFIKGRLKFGKSKNSAPFPSLIAIFHNKEGLKQNFIEVDRDMESPAYHEGSMDAAKDITFLARQVGLVLEGDVGQVECWEKAVEKCRQAGRESMKAECVDILEDAIQDCSDECLCMDNSIWKRVLVSSVLLVLTVVSIWFLINKKKVIDLPVGDIKPVAVEPSEFPDYNSLSDCKCNSSYNGKTYMTFHILHSWSKWEMMLKKNGTWNLVEESEILPNGNKLIKVQWIMQEKSCTKCNKRIIRRQRI